MSKLSELAAESQKLLRMAAQDAGLDPNAGTWVAKDFYNQGVGFNAEYEVAEIDVDQAAAYTRTIDAITTVDRGTKWSVRGVNPATILQSAHLAKLADDGETVRIGLLPPDEGIDESRILWRPLVKERAEAIISFFEDWVDYRGMLQGRIHNLFKESSPPYFNFRDFASGELIRCEFKETLWDSLHKSLERKDAVVIVVGWISAKRIDKSIRLMRVEKMQSTKPFHHDDLLRFFGSAPGWTGDLTTDEFIDAIRRDDGE